MKKLLLIVTALIGLLVACRNPAEGSPDDPNNPVNPGQKTVIVFDNTQGICAVAVYNDDQRKDEDKIAEIPAGTHSQEIEWTPGTSVAFYFTYRISLKGISGFTVNYNPEVGKDQTAVPVNAHVKTNIVIPKLDETLSSPDTLLSNNSYILIQNNSSYSFQLLRGDGIIQPDNLSNSLVISGERARYTINAEAASPYRLLLGADYIPFPGSMVSFEAGRVYSFIFNNGALSLILEVEMKLENVAGVSLNIPEAPDAPAVTASDGLLTVRWTAVEGAGSYEVYIGTGLTPPALPERTVYTTTAALTGRTNKTPYYVWVKAANENGVSDFSPRVRGIPWPANEIPAVPGSPVIIPGINQLTVDWEEAGGASSYEVYVNTTPSTPSAVAVTSDKTGAVINNLENDVIYYIWVRAVNSAGRSGYSPVVSGTPRIPTVAPAAPSCPVLAAGNRELAVSWQAVEFAGAYEVWYGITDDSVQAQKFGGDITGGVTETVITGLTNGTTYYVWIKAKNSVGTSDFSPPANGTPSALSVAPQAPTVPAVSIGNEQITVTWTAVDGAMAYEIWLGTSNSSASAAKNGDDESDSLSRTISGLTNGTAYYIWLKAKNDAGTSGFSPSANGKPLGTPGTPTVTPGLNQLQITWTAVPGADEYEVYYGTGTTPTTLATTTTGNTATITGLTNGTTYYIRLKAKNANGISDYGPNASNSPNVTPGLYRGAEKIGNQNLSASLSYISSNAVTGDNFFILLGADESVSPMNLNYSGKTVGITLLGYGGERTITFNANGDMFTINAGVTLTLDENITLNGNNNSIGVSVSGGTFTMNGGTINGFNTGVSVSDTGVLFSGGTFTMNNGTISGSTGMGVYIVVSTFGTFTMNGGVISGTISNGGVYVGYAGTVTMNGGIISGNENKGENGGGVTVLGTFTMYNGVISGNTAARFGGGVFVDISGSFTMHGGIISGNTAGEVGGGVFVSGYYTNGGTFKKLPNGGGQNSGIIYGNEETGVDTDGTPLKNTTPGYSHAVYVYSLSRYRNTTAGQTDHIDTTTGRGLSANGEPPYGE
jgi:hypothetical protein